MAKTRKKPAASESRLFVLALGLLVGFVTAFVVLLSRLPVDGIIAPQGEHSAGAQMTDINFDYYSVLQEQQAARKAEPQVVAVQQPVVFMEQPTANQLPHQRMQSPQLARQVPVQARAEIQPGTRPAPLPAAPQVARQTLPPRVNTAPSVQLQVREILASKSGQDSYYVEAGNYRANGDALRAQSVLRTLGLEAFIVVRQDNLGSFGHRVRIGPFFEQSSLDATRNTLRQSGITLRLIRIKG